MRAGRLPIFVLLSGKKNKSKRSEILLTPESPKKFDRHGLFLPPEKREATRWCDAWGVWSKHYYRVGVLYPAFYGETR